jgi:hypothetical protein
MRLPQQEQGKGQGSGSGNKTYGRSHQGSTVPHCVSLSLVRDDVDIHAARLFRQH